MQEEKNVCIVLTKDQEEFGNKLISLNLPNLPNLTFIVPESEEEIRHSIGKANIILGNPLIVKRYINDAARVTWMQSIFAGVDAMNSEGLRKDYTLTNVKDIYGAPMAEYVFAYVLAFSRDVFGNRERQKERAWKQKDVGTLEGKTLGVLGTGSIGREIARKGKAFGMRTLGYNTKGTPAEFFDETFGKASLKDFLSEADYAVSVLPNTEDTTDIINAESIAWMKPTATFFNIGRGNAVNEEDLAAAMKAQKIQRAVLDVFKEEPLLSESPLWAVENVFITPHVSGYMIGDKIFEIFEENYLRFTKGEQLKYVVDLKKGY